jgi:CBS-domain-containing membrane protein
MAPAGDVTSSGLVAGDDPLHYALLLLIVQVAIIIVLSRFITLLFRPLRQPRVVAGTPSLSRFCWGVCVYVCMGAPSLSLSVSVSVAVLQTRFLKLLSP